MSMSDSDSSSYAGADYKSFKQISREQNHARIRAPGVKDESFFCIIDERKHHWERNWFYLTSMYSFLFTDISPGLLHEMLRSSKTGDSKSTWKVLIMDKLTVKIMSHSCKMTDITDEGVSLVEDIYKRRQPLPTMDAIYFIQPTREKAFVFFSSAISKELVMDIKKDTKVLTRLGALREMNLEYFPIDSQGFITNNERALEELFGDEENNHKGVTCLNVMAKRIATVFASLREFPSVRFRAAKSLDATTMTTFRDLIPTKLAAGVWDCLMKYKKSIPNFPQTETCELLIVDRSIDQIAPVIHEWTYDAMCHDLLNMEGNKYVHEVPGKSGGPAERKEVLLEDHDPIWLELRHAHIAYASEQLHEKMTNFISKNKAAQIQHGSKWVNPATIGSARVERVIGGQIHFLRSSSEMSTRDIQKMVQALPQYSEQIDKLSLHVEIAGKINRIIRESGLRELGQLEQDLVFGDATTKDVIKFFTMTEDIAHENKLRLLMILASVCPEKFEGEKGQNLMRLAKLTEEDMNVVHNMRMLGGQPVTKKKLTTAFGLKFDIHKKKRAARKDRPGEEEKWQLSRFYPIIELRVCHKLTEKLKREIILGSSSLDDPAQFITKLKMITTHELSLDDIQI
ncbi:hypothetical protein JHK84_030141 [Glycine max]|nr:hypothetical protein JHK84_030141 [Glycine max]